MNVDQFHDYLERYGCYETIYEDSDGKVILVIRFLDAYALVNKLINKEREEFGNK
jgi:hypothetical protein